MPEREVRSPNNSAPPDAAPRRTGVSPNSTRGNYADGHLLRRVGKNSRTNPRLMRDDLAPDLQKIAAGTSGGVIPPVSDRHGR